MDEEVTQVEEETRESTKILNVIPVEIVEECYNSATHSRGKYYKQTYRPAWEQMPDFKGWLRGVEGEPTRAYCIYCQKTLHAHRLSLLKHTCTIRHQKAAQLHSMRKIKPQIMTSQENRTVIINEEVSSQDDLSHEDGDESMVEYAEGHTLDMEDADGDQMHDLENVHEEEDEDDNTEVVHLEVHETFDKHFHEQAYSTTEVTPPVATHVIDSSRGTPVGGLQVSLYKLIDGRWTYINEGFTNQSGKFSKFLENSAFTAGRYKLHYDVDRYFDSRKQESLYPFIEIVFDSHGKNEHYNIPLILSPYGYSTHRGS